MAFFSCDCVFFAKNHVGLERMFSPKTSEMRKYNYRPMVFIFLLFAGIINTLHLYAQKNDENSLLWEISGNGLKKPSYLYGTMHVSNKLAFHLTDTFFLGIKNCDLVALEINPDNWFKEMTESDYMSEMLGIDGTNFQYGGFYNTAFELKLLQNADFASVLATDHSLTNYLLYRFGSMDGNFEENTYLDLFIYQTGKKQNKKIAALERMDQMLKLLEKSYLPDENDVNYYEQNDMYEKIMETGKTPQELMEEAYRNGDLKLLDSISNMMNPSKNFHKYMIVERNKIMAHTLDSLLKTYSVFAGCGAAHLPGKEGIIEILRSKGYTVRPTQRTFSKKADQLKEKSEKTVFPLSYSRQFSSDSLFSLNAPGEMLENGSFGNNTEYFYPEMVNGSSFVVSRINHYGKLTGQDENYLMKRIDSLFYENIPGKVISKKTINKNGYPGYDILNKTRRGDYQRFNILITPLEIIVMKMGGIGDFVKTEGDKYFNSLKFEKKSSDWKSCTSRKGGFTISMPSGVFKSLDHLDRTSSGELYQAVDEKDGSYYLVMKASLHDFEYIEEDTFELNYITSQVLKELKYNKKGSALLSVQGYPAIDVEAADKSGNTIFLRMIIKGADYYLLCCKRPENKKPEEFLKSFAFSGYKYEKKFEEYRDTTMFFTVKTIDPPSESSSQNLYPYSYGLTEKEKQEMSHMSNYLTKNFKCSQTGEEVRIEYLKFHKYQSYDLIDSLWSENIMQITFANGLIVKEKKISQVDSLYTLELLLTDTNSTRAIREKLILNRGVLYCMSACIDTISGMGNYAGTFFNTFAPADTIIEKSVFSDKARFFFEALKNGDSLTVKQALNSVDFVNISDKHFKSLSESIRDKKAYKYTLSERAGLISLFSSLKTPESVKFLEDYYNEIEDTTTLQIAILNTLTSQKTIESTRAFIRCMVKNTPFTNNTYEFTTLFYSLSDSLELTKALFPDIMQLTQYYEYKGFVYDLLSTLADSGLISIKNYEPYKEAIIKEARIELKKQQSDNEETETEYSYNAKYNDYYYYTGSESGYFYASYPFMDYLILLAPFYSEPQVKKIFDKIFRIKNDELKFAASVVMAKNQIPVNDTVWSYYLKKDNFRVTAYKEMKKLKLESKIDNSLITQENIAKSIVLSSFNLTPKDTIVFLGKRETSSKGKKGNVYFFKTKFEADKFWTLLYTGFQPSDTTQISAESDFEYTYDRLNQLKSVEEQIDEKIEEIYLLGRQRVSTYNNYGYYPYYGY
ncbi:MAG: hypothetical protein A2W91_00565 [Bacteroidetes bacterium GWF2_38_335]|nr:MAG: hypothetical protein A2W91_00565 [Bacteroidetes bacterium GWF2_38_335]OFY78325.1 MAG: hypothetical protein A2281_03945 [Bacteroidetes bacterium RIFOXYA12_FULL_38_20]HBS87479.1 hypothetical protein [Bacteroidales bacterium]